MKPTDRREQERLKTRSAILDATEALMREEGYAAVTSRRVAERAGLKSQLVHYHFGTMDELFQEAFRRNEKKFFSRHLKALTSPNPLLALWELSVSSEGMDLVSEYVSAANHRKVLKDELAQAWSRYRLLHNSIISKHFSDHSVDPGDYTPEVLSFMIASISNKLVDEVNLGFTEGHAEIIAFMKSLLKRLGPQAREEAAVARRGRPKPKRKVAREA